MDTMTKLNGLTKRLFSDEEPAVQQPKPRQWDINKKSAADFSRGAQESGSLNLNWDSLKKALGR